MKALSIALILIYCVTANAETKAHLEPLGWFGVYLYDDVRRFIDETSVEDTTEKVRLLIFKNSYPLVSIAIAHVDDTGDYNLIYRENTKPSSPIRIIDIRKDVALKLEELFYMTAMSARYYNDEELPYERLEGPQYIVSAGSFIGIAKMPVENEAVKKLAYLIDMLAKYAGVPPSERQSMGDRILSESESIIDMWCHVQPSSTVGGGAASADLVISSPVQAWPGC